MTMVKNPAFEKRPRRYRILSISADVLLNLYLGGRKDGDDVRFISAAGLPDGVEVEAVLWNDMTRCFEFRLWHSSFDAVQEYQQIPMVQVECTEHRLRVVSGQSPSESRAFGREFL